MNEDQMMDTYKKLLEISNKYNSEMSKIAIDFRDREARSTVYLLTYHDSDELVGELPKFLGVFETRKDANNCKLVFIQEDLEVFIRNEYKHTKITPNTKSIELAKERLENLYTIHEVTYWKSPKP